MTTANDIQFGGEHYKQNSEKLHDGLPPSRGYRRNFIAVDRSLAESELVSIDNVAIFIPTAPYCQLKIPPSSQFFQGVNRYTQAGGAVFAARPRTAISFLHLAPARFFPA